MKIDDKLNALRQEMADRNIDAYIIPSSDPHGSEYPVRHWQARAWVSSFNGSAGTVVVTQTSAGLWTDGRYHIVAEELLANLPIDLFKQGVDGVPTVNEWLTETLNAGATVGFDGRLFGVKAVNMMKKEFLPKKLKIVSEFDLFEKIWTDRPALPFEKQFDHLVKFSGKSRKEKLAEIRAKMAACKASAHLLTTLDDIAWLFNIRTANTMPAFGQAYAVIEQDNATLFIPEANITDVKATLTKDGVKTLPYETITDYLKAIKASAVLIDPAAVNWTLYNLIPESCRKVEVPNPTNLMKSIKNQVEVANSRNAHIKDGVAMVQFIHWLECNIGKIKITELSADEMLTKCRWAQNNSFGPSFGTIPAYKEHAAMAHYSATPEGQHELKPEGLFLVDSGGQYLDGLTDTTRTFALGPVSEEQKIHYTLVLKGMLSLSMAKFLKGTRGCNLDIIARQPLWDHGLDYRHGTGHGVGYFLNVHEGPQGFSQGLNDVPMEVGMMTTIEPGYYVEGSHGIRIENIVVTQKEEETQWGEFYSFEALTLVPIDKKPIVKTLMSEREINYLNSYHQNVYEKLSPFLSESESTWLKAATSPL